MSWISPTFLSANCSQAERSMSSLLLVIFTWKNAELFKSYIIEFLEQDMGVYS